MRKAKDIQRRLSYYGRLYLLASLLLLAFSAFGAKVGGAIEYPPYFPPPIYSFAHNPLDSSTVTLGRALFYDPILSQNNTISCASCHSPYNAFAHTDHDLSHGINDEIGTRNAPALFNLAWHPSFMWDGAINHLDMQPLAPITNPKEMGESIKNVAAKLQHTTLYPSLFQRAFGDSMITGEHILKAIAQFQLTLVSATAKYDRVQNGNEQFSEQENKGYALFRRFCNSCHTEPLFSSFGFASNGLPLDTTLNDKGRAAISNNPQDSLLFKIPSLRNLSYTYPYMHDGRFKKLSQVLNHYTSGVAEFADTRLRGGIPLSAHDKADLIAFLLTLDDKDFVFTPQHQYPKDILKQEKFTPMNIPSEGGGK